MNNKRIISFAVEDFLYEELIRYSLMKGHDSKRPVAAFARHAMIQQMKKYPITEAETKKYEETYGKSLKSR